MNIDMPDTTYADILQRLVRRYLFKCERQKMEGDGKKHKSITWHKADSACWTKNEYIKGLNIRLW